MSRVGPHRDVRYRSCRVNRSVSDVPAVNVAVQLPSTRKTGAGLPLHGEVMAMAAGGDRLRVRVVCRCPAPIEWLGRLPAPGIRRAGFARPGSLFARSSGTCGESCRPHADGILAAAPPGAGPVLLR